MPCSCREEPGLMPPPSRAFELLALLLANNIVIYAIGIGNYDEVQLKAVASSDKHVIFLNSFSDLSEFAATLTAETCSEPQPLSLEKTITGSDFVQKKKKRPLKLSKGGKEKRACVSSSSRFKEASVDTMNSLAKPYAPKNTIMNSQWAFNNLNLMDVV